MGIIDDPISGVIGLFFKRALESKIGRRAELILEMAIASLIAGCGACGASLLAGEPVAWSIGAGLVAVAVAVLATFQASPNSKGLVISIQQQVSSAKIEEPMTTIERK